jgi:hypothetical protein
MSARQSSFAAYAEMRELVVRMTAFADSLVNCMSGAAVLTLRREVLPFIRRNPRTAALFQIAVPAAGTCGNDRSGLS